MTDGHPFNGHGGNGHAGRVIFWHEERFALRGLEAVAGEFQLVVARRKVDLKLAVPIGMRCFKDLFLAGSGHGDSGVR